jgi:hypothetical protein
MGSETRIVPGLTASLTLAGVLEVPAEAPPTISSHKVVNYQVHLGYINRLFWVIDKSTTTGRPDYVTYNKADLKPNLIQLGAISKTGLGTAAGDNGGKDIAKLLVARESAYRIESVDKPPGAGTYDDINFENTQINDALSLIDGTSFDNFMTDINTKLASTDSNSYGEVFLAKAKTEADNAVGINPSTDQLSAAGAQGAGVPGIHKMYKFFETVAGSAATAFEGINENTSMDSGGADDAFGLFSGSFHETMINQARHTSQTGGAPPLEILDNRAPNSAVPDSGPPAGGSPAGLNYKRAFDHGSPQGGNFVRAFALSFNPNTTLEFVLDVTHAGGAGTRPVNSVVNIKVAVVPDTTVITAENKFFLNDVADGALTIPEIA